MVRLLIAAGGGGDALAAAVVHTARRPGVPAVIAAYSWDRLLIDPLPGPRVPADFTGLGPRGRVTPATRPRPPAGSTLPALAVDLPAELVLLDPSGGARGMAAQIRAFGAEQVEIVDVGGDALAHGDEPGLRSPLADGLVLAACAGLPADVLVAGPGLDGELPEALVMSRAEYAFTLTERDFAPFETALARHPSEATALLAAAARGLRGRAEIRDGGLPVRLTDHSAQVLRTPLAAVDSPLVRALAGSASLPEAERLTREICGFSELDYERHKAGRPRPARLPENLDESIRAFERAARQRGADYVTFRRIAEAIGAPLAELRSHLLATRPENFTAPLWALHH